VIYAIDVDYYYYLEVFTLGFHKSYTPEWRTFTENVTSKTQLVE